MNDRDIVQFRKLNTLIKIRCSHAGHSKQTITHSWHLRTVAKLYKISLFGIPLYQLLVNFKTFSTSTLINYKTIENVKNKTRGTIKSDV